MHLIFWLNGWFGFLQSIQGNCLEHRDYLPLLHSFLRILVPCCLLLVQRTGYPCALRRRDLQWTYGISSRESVASPLELGHQIWQAGGYSSKLGYQFETTDLDICFHMFSCLVPQSYFLGAWGLMILSHKPCVARVICNFFCRLPNARDSSQSFASIVSDQNLIAPNFEADHETDKFLGNFE